MPKISNLDKRLRLFARKYIELKFNGTQAAIAAGYSKKTATSQASDLLSRPDVQTMLAEETAKLHAKLDIQQEEVLKDALTAAQLDITDILEIGSRSVTIKDLSKVPVEIRRTIQEIEEKKDGIKVKFESRAAARDFIAKVKGWYKEQPFTGGARLVFLNLGDGEKGEE